MKIKRAIERFPGGMMVIPLLWGSVLNTFAPHVLAIGSFSTQLAHGALPILAVFFVCMGAEIQLRTAPGHCATARRSPSPSWPAAWRSASR